MDVHDLRRKAKDAESKWRRFGHYRPTEMPVGAYCIRLAELKVAAAQAELDFTRATVADLSSRGAIEATVEREVETDEGRIETVRGHGLVVLATDTRDGEAVLLATEGSPSERQERALEDALYEAVAP